MSQGQRAAPGVVRSPLSGEVVLDGVAGGRAARGHSQLVVDRADMGMDGAWTQHQLFGDLEVGQTTRNQVQYLHFACCQPVGIGW